MKRLVVSFHIPTDPSTNTKGPDRPPKSNLQMVEVQLKFMYKNMTKVLYAGLRDKEYPAQDVHVLELTNPFKGPDQMRKALSNFPMARILLGNELYAEVADMVNHRDPFVIVVKDDKSVWAAVAPLEG